jgi:hypothetical protein
MMRSWFWGSIILASCAPTTPYLIDGHEMAKFGTHRFHESRREVFTAAVKAISKIGLPIAREDAEAGRVETECVDNNDRWREHAREIGCRSYLLTVAATDDGGSLLRAEPHFWWGGREVSSKEWNATKGREQDRWDTIFSAVRAAL